MGTRFAAVESILPVPKSVENFKLCETYIGTQKISDLKASQPLSISSFCGRPIIHSRKDIINVFSQCLSSLDLNKLR